MSDPLAGLDRAAQSAHAHDQAAAGEFMRSLGAVTDTVAYTQAAFGLLHLALAAVSERLRSHGHVVTIEPAIGWIRIGARGRFVAITNQLNVIAIQPSITSAFAPNGDAWTVRAREPNDLYIEVRDIAMRIGSFLMQ